MKSNGPSFTFAMVALACSVGVAAYSIYLANALLGQNRTLQSRLVAEAETSRIFESNLRISNEVERLDTERRTAARLELEAQQRKKAAEEGALAAEAQRKFAEKEGLSIELEREIAPGVNMVFRLIPPGTFQMGSPEDEAFHNADEILHTVEITKGFYLGKFEITQKQWLAVMGSNPSYCNEALMKRDTSEFPVDQVNYPDLLSFCEKLRQGRGLPVRAPTEAEWEYACRAGTTTPSWMGPVPRDNQGRFLEGHQDPVGTYLPNPFGLHDVSGNVWEWCSDFYGPFTKDPAKDPVGQKTGPYRIMRGGPWNDSWGPRRSAFRFKLPDDLRWNRHGARLVLPLESAKPKP